MSVRAYKIIEIRHEKGETFNLWHDTKLTDFFKGETGVLDGLNADGGGIIDILQDDIKNWLMDKRLHKLYDFGEYELAVLRAMLADCGDEGYVQYYCF